MLYTVEVRLIGGEFIGFMTQMRTWLDHRRIEPDAFRHSSGGAGVTFRVDFKVETEADAFASAFGGRVIGPAPVVGSSPSLLWASAGAAAGAGAGFAGRPPPSGGGAARARPRAPG